MSELLDTSNLILTDSLGKERTYILSKFPAVQGRKITTQYPLSAITSAIPKLGDYEVNEKIMLELMSFVAVELPGGIEQKLNSLALVNNHVPDWQTLAKIEMAMMEKNCDFFHNGRISDFLGDCVRKAMPKILEMLMASSVQSSPTEKQPSTN